LEIMGQLAPRHRSRLDESAAGSHIIDLQGIKRSGVYTQSHNIYTIACYWFCLSASLVTYPHYVCVYASAAHTSFRLTIIFLVDWDEVCTVAKLYKYCSEYLANGMQIVLAQKGLFLCADMLLDPARGDVDILPESRHFRIVYGGVARSHNKIEK
jgi:hypothetical protein